MCHPCQPSLSIIYYACWRSHQGRCSPVNSWGLYLWIQQWPHDFLLCKSGAQTGWLWTLSGSEAGNSQKHLKATTTFSTGMAPRCCKTETGRKFGVKRLVCMSENRISTASGPMLHDAMSSANLLLLSVQPPRFINGTLSSARLRSRIHKVELGMGVGISRICWIFSRIWKEDERSFWWNVCDVLVKLHCSCSCQEASNHRQHWPGHQFLPFLQLAKGAAQRSCASRWS